MKRVLVLLAIMTVCATSVQANASISDSVWKAIQEAYHPAVWNKGLETGYVEPDPSKFHNYVVVMVGGMAAERAARVISWGPYDYRAVKIDAAKGTVENRRGRAYTYLQPGDVMAIAAISKLGNSIYMKLISPDVYKPTNREGDKKFSRVTDTVQIVLPKTAAKSSNPAEALSLMAQYIKPFTSIEAAQSFAPSAQLPSSTALVTEQTPETSPSTPLKADEETEE